MATHEGPCGHCKIELDCSGELPALTPYEQQEMDAMYDRAIDEIRRYQRYPLLRDQYHMPGVHSWDMVSSLE